MGHVNGFTPQQIKKRWGGWLAIQTDCHGDVVFCKHFPTRRDAKVASCTRLKKQLSLGSRPTALSEWQVVSEAEAIRNSNNMLEDFIGAWGLCHRWANVLLTAEGFVATLEPSFHSAIVLDFTADERPLNIHLTLNRVEKEFIAAAKAFDPAQQFEDGWSEKYGEMRGITKEAFKKQLEKDKASLMEKAAIMCGEFCPD